MEGTALPGNPRQIALSAPQIGATLAITLPSKSVREGVSMRKLWLVLLLSGSFALAQDSKPTTPSEQKSKVSKGEITVQGCVGTSSGDYVLVKQDPAITYELQGTGK